MTRTPRPGDEGTPWAEQGALSCAVEGCERRGIVKGLCETHADPSEHTRSRTRVGQPSGRGRFGVVDRGPDWVLCHECGRTFKRLELHIIRSHEMQVSDYRSAHGLPAREPLLCQDLIDRFSQTSRERVGSPGWRRLEEAREASRGALVEAAAEANRGRVRAAGVTQGVRGSAVRERTCPVCGSVFEVSGTRSREVCSRECWMESKARAAGRRSAAKVGEPEDFVRRDGSGRRLRLADVAEALGVSTDGARTRVARGRLVEHAGRERWVAFWWESDLP